MIDQSIVDYSFLIF